MKRKATVDIGSASDVGMMRRENQDAMGYFPAEQPDLESEKGLLCVVADGMGGHSGGRDASSLAVTTVPEVYFAMQGATIAESLHHALQEANARIYRTADSDPALRGMGTTCCALVLQQHTATIAHVGDSRVYRITGTGIEQLTRDHSKVAEMVRRGILTKEEAEHHPERSHLYRALGVRPTTEVDIIGDIALSTDESFLLCSDGLYQYVPDAELRTLVLERRPQEACDMLVELANRRGGSDNISVIVVRVHYSGSFLDRLAVWETR